VAGVPAGFEPLRDDRVDTMRGQPACFVNGGCRCEDFRAAGPNTCQQRRRRQAEMEAYDGGSEFVEQVGGFGVERRACWARRDGVDAELGVIRCQGHTPCRFALGVWHRAACGRRN